MKYFILVLILLLTAVFVYLFLINKLSNRITNKTKSITDSVECVNDEVAMGQNYCVSIKTSEDMNEQKIGIRGKNSSFSFANDSGDCGLIKGIELDMDNLLLGCGSKIFVVNMSDKKLNKTFSSNMFNFNIGSYFLVNEKAPVALVAFQYEGPDEITHLINVSKEDPELIETYKYGTVAYNDDWWLNEPKVIWDQNEVVINYFKIEKLTSLVLKEDAAVTDNARADELENIYEAKFMASNKYERVKCNLGGRNEGIGNTFGCVGLISASPFSFSWDLE